MERKNVYELVSGERAYQDGKFPLGKNPRATRPISNWILYIENQLALAKQAIYDCQSTTALEHIRKATALGVACMELHETSAR